MWSHEDPSKSPDLKPGEKIIICWTSTWTPRGEYLACCAEVLNGQIFPASMPPESGYTIEWKKEWAWIPVPGEK